VLQFFPEERLPVRSRLLLEEIFDDRDVDMRNVLIVGLRQRVDDRFGLRRKALTQCHGTWSFVDDPRGN